MNSKNSDVRKKAWARCKANWKPLTAVSFFSAALAALGYLTVFLTPLAGGVKSVVLVAFNALIYPITGAGVSYVFLSAWRGRAARFGDTFHFCASPALWLRGVLLGLIYHLILRAFSLPGNIRALLPQGSATVYAFLAISAACSFFSVWVTIRLSLSSYMLAADGEIKPCQAIAASFGAMKGSAGAYIRMIMAVLWWLPVAAGILLWLSLILLYRVLPAGISEMLRNSDMGQAVTFLAFTAEIILSPFMAYPSLSLAGFADSRIPSERDLKKRRKKSNADR